ncbi:unnamed protein product [Boreogadus saida]
MVKPQSQHSGGRGVEQAGCSYAGDGEASWTAPGVSSSPAGQQGPLDNIVAGVAWLRQNAGLLRGKVVEPAVRNMDPKEQQELLERIQDTDEEEKYPLLFTFDFQEDMEEVFHNMAAEEDLRVNAMFLGRWVDSQ